MATLGLLLAGCATPAPYKPAVQAREPGYFQTQLADQRYRVSFTGNSSTAQQDVLDYALLRSAQLTLAKGYDWFEVVNRNNDKEVQHTVVGGSTLIVPPQTQVYRDCGLLACRTTVVSAPGYATGIGAGTAVPSSSYTSALEILMGHNPKPQGGNIYNAQELASSLNDKISGKS